jgi:3-mercaptopyruvate sulfurtransferase SseA
MRLFFSLSAAVVLAVLMLAACNSKEMKGNVASNGSSATTPGTSSTQNVPSDGVRRVTTVELRAALDKGTALVVDTRPLEAYKQSHIKGSVSIPLDQVANRIGELPRDKMIVAYCS